MEDEDLIQKDEAKSTGNNILKFVAILELCAVF
jgi:hypothetical protein